VGWKTAIQQIGSLRYVRSVSAVLVAACSMANSRHSNITVPQWDYCVCSEHYSRAFIVTDPVIESLGLPKAAFRQPKDLLGARGRELLPSFHNRSHYVVGHRPEKNMNVIRHHDHSRSRYRWPSKNFSALTIKLPTSAWRK
jgi:hypothetical protein